MDQQGVSYESLAPDLFGPDHRPLLERPKPLGPLALTLSLFGIAGSAVLLCCVAAVVVLMVLVADGGRAGASDFLEQLKFDAPLQTRIGAAVVGLLYVGLATGTLAAALLRGGRRWPTLVAFSPVRPVWRGIASIITVTLAYAVLATYAIEHGRDRTLLIGGPTDMLLIGLIVANLVLLAPLAEELLFRGWIYTALRQKLGFWPSFLVTSVLFAAIHWDAHHRRFVQVLPLAIGLGILRERAASIKPTIALHAAYNLIIILIRLAYT